MPKQIAWSWSRLDTFELCPRKFQGTYITKEFPQPDFDAPHFAKGKAAHYMMEEHFKPGSTTPLHGNVYSMRDPKGKMYYSMIANGEYEDDFYFDFRFLTKLCNKLKKAGTVKPELQVTFDVRMNQISWFDKKAWCRVIFDLLVIVNETAFILDWKTGKVKPFSDQLKLFAGAVMTKYPQVKRVLSAYIWLEHPTQAPIYKEYTRADQEAIWLDFGDRAELIQLANESGNWPAKKNMFCKWCDALPNMCEFKPF